MRGEELLDVMEHIDSDIIESAEKYYKKDRRLIKWCAAAAACVVLVIIGAFAFKPDIPKVEDRITVSEDGVYIPPKNVTLSKEEAAEMDMIGFFIYGGRCYVQYEWIYEDVDIIGEHLGTVTGMIDEWTEQDGYVDLAGSVIGDFYSVKGYDPEFMLCMRGSSGIIEMYVNDSDMTLKTGADLFEDKLHLTENSISVDYENNTSWNEGKDELYGFSAAHEQTIMEFVSALNAAPFMRISDIPLREDETSIYRRQIYHVYFRQNDGTSIHLRLFDGGYVNFDGLNGVCVKMEDNVFNNLVDIMDRGEGTALSEDPSAYKQYRIETIDECCDDEYFGKYVPDYIPEGFSFSGGNKYYDIEKTTGDIIGTSSLQLSYDGAVPSIYYSVEICDAEDYGENGWAGTMLYARELAVEVLEDNMENLRDGTVRLDIGVYIDDVMIVLGGKGFSAQDAYNILASMIDR